MNRKAATSFSATGNSSLLPYLLVAPAEPLLPEYFRTTLPASTAYSILFADTKPRLRSSKDRRLHAYKVIAQRHGKGNIRFKTAGIPYHTARCLRVSSISQLLGSSCGFSNRRLHLSAQLDLSVKNNFHLWITFANLAIISINFRGTSTVRNTL